MANELPRPKSYEALLGEMLASYMSQIGVDDLNTGSPNTLFFESVALHVARASGDVFQILRDTSVDRARGEALKRIAASENVTLPESTVATGFVNISDSRFDKVSTKVYAGSAAPNVGSTTIRVGDASEFTATGTIYIGRGTPNVEGPLSYSSVTETGGFWEISLSSPTTKFHNTGESVILGQGGARTIAAGTVVISPARGASQAVRFSTVSPAIILDGEVTVSNVRVAAQKPGVDGNVPRGGIKEFSGTPFTGATVTNSLPIKNGRNAPTDEEIKTLIKRARLSRGLGTALAIENSALGVTVTDEQATVVSDQIVSEPNKTVLFIDDGTGYEQKTSGVSRESLVDSALGGEDTFQLATGGRQTSVAKAFLSSSLSQPFNIFSTDRIAISVGGTTTEHIFQLGDFVSEGGATSFEVVSSINANTDLGWVAKTTNGGTGVLIEAKVDESEFIQVQDVSAGTDASEALGLQSNEVQTIRLFKNKVPLNKDGRSASVFSARQSDWSAGIASGDSLIVSVDGTGSITYTILDSDFAAEGTHPTVSSSNSLSSWAAVINNKVTGITAEVVGEQLKLSSNLGASNRAAVSVDASSGLVSKGMFTSAQGLSAQGSVGDFIMSRNTAQLKLATPLSEGDELTAGNRDTEGRVSTSPILGGNVTLTTEANLWVVIDDQDAEVISTGVVSGTTVTVSKPTGTSIRYTSNSATAFDNVQVGDYVIVWSDELSSANRGEFRVSAKTSTTLDVEVTSSESSAAVAEGPIVFEDGFVVLRGSSAPIRLEAVSGVRTLSSIAQEFSSQTSLLDFSVVDDEVLSISTLTRDKDQGSVMVATADSSAKTLRFTEGVQSLSSESLISFYSTVNEEGSFPEFFVGTSTAESSANPPDSFISSVTGDTSAASVDPEAMVCFLHPSDGIEDNVSVGACAQVRSISGAALTISQSSFVKRVRSGDRFYLSRPFDFGHNDSVVFVLEGNTSERTFEVPLYRRAIANTTHASSNTDFNAYDVESGATASFSSSFGSSFSFDGFRALMRAKKVLDHSANEDAILYRSTRWGRSGERTNVGYIYPTSADNEIGSTISVGENTEIRISLKSGPTVATTIDGTTEWNVTITPNTPVAGVDQVTYTHSGTGTAPGLGSLSGGEYVTITPESGFSESNIGTFRVSDEPGFLPTATSFTVVRPNGEATAESDISTFVTSAINFYDSDTTTAAEIVEYVGSDLSEYITAELVDDSGTTGAGVIDKSTYEDSDFSYSNVQLLDGINWIATTDLGSDPQFVFENPLSLSTDTGYAFNDGEEVRLVPTTIDHINRLWNTLPVSGITTLSEVVESNKGIKIDVSTLTLGSNGSVQVVGGSGNSVNAAVIGIATAINNDKSRVTVSKSAGSGIHSDQWLKLTAIAKQNLTTLLTGAASISLDPGSPSAGKTTVSLLNLENTSRAFGYPKTHIRTRGRVFLVEKHGSLVGISWDGTGTAPVFQQAANLDDSGGGTVNVETIDGSNDVNYIVLTGVANFRDIRIGDMITIDNMANSENNGTFVVTGVSADGTTIRVNNTDGVDEFSTGTFTITNNANVTGDTFEVDSNNFVEGTDFSAGATADDTAANLASVINALSTVSASSSGNVVTVTALSPSASITISYTDSGSGVAATVSGASLAGTSFSAGDFASTMSLGEGDHITLGAPFDILNRGKFRVVRRFNNTVYIEHPGVKEERVTLLDNLISLGHDATTGFDIVNTSNSIVLKWDGSGTEPSLGNAVPGDVLRLGTDFAAANQGDFCVLEGGEKLQEITDILCARGTDMVSGQYFTINSAGDATGYYVWYNVGGGGGDPAPGGLTAIEVAVGSGDTAEQVAAATALAIGALADFSASSSGETVTVTTTGYDATTDAANVDVGGQFNITVKQQGRVTFIEAQHPSAAAETGVTVTGDVLELHRPAIIAHEYNATLPGDSFNIAGDFLGDNSEGSFVVDEIKSKSSIVVTGTTDSVFQNSLSGQSGNITVTEESAYSGYKRVHLIATDPANDTRLNIVFDSNAQQNKINGSAGVSVSSVSSLGFPTKPRKGIDAYRYHTGLIAEVNRVIYGEPRDRSTYPGVSAAGAEIFIEEPLTKRISVGIVVRLNTGVPFNQIVEQIRTAVSALIESNSIGKSIAISDIVSVVNAIPGVRAVSIDSPQYDPQNDVISIVPSEKARIIDPTVDILVSEVG